MPWKPDDVVPRRMLEMSKDTLRRCLAANIDLKHRLEDAQGEVRRLEDVIRRYRRNDNGNSGR